jgi:hypothetical protein
MSPLEVHAVQQDLASQEFKQQVSRAFLSTCVYFNIWTVFGRCHSRFTRLDWPQPLEVSALCSKALPG